MQQLEPVHDDRIGRAQKSEFARLHGAASNLSRRHALEMTAKRAEEVAILHSRGGAHREFLATPAGRDQAHAGFDQTDVAFERGHRPVAMQDELATATECHAVDSGNGWHGAGAQRLGSFLERGDDRFDLLETPGHQRIGDVERSRRLQHHGLRLAPESLDHAAERGRPGAGHPWRRRPREIGADGKRRFGLPDHETAKIALRDLDGLVDAIEHVIADGVHAALEAQDRDVVAQSPATNGRGFEEGGADDVVFAENPIRHRLPPIHREHRARAQGSRGRAP